MSDDFFVGYLPTPPTLVRRLSWIVGSMIALAVAIALTGAFLQKGYAKSVFEYGQYRTLEGTILEQPYPMLMVHRPGQDHTAFSAYLLVDQFKHGADEHVQGLAGKFVRLQGQLIYRDDHTMLELKPGPLEMIAPPAGQHAPLMRPMGPMTVTGEIVDSKCYLGVMNPGSGKVHRDCAARCISGGVPAAFVATDREHSGSFFLLKSAYGGQIPRELLAHAGEPLTIQGEALGIGDQLFLFSRTFRGTETSSMQAR